jgi:sporulation protein YqfC
MRKWASKWLDLPADVTSEAPRIEMIGPFRIRVENHRGVVKFTREQVRLNLENGALEIDGENLKIRRIDSTIVILEGNVQGLRYAGQGGE